MPIIVLEGANGTGTSTQCNKLKEYLENFGKKVYLTRHPGSTDLGQHLRKILKFGDVNTTPQQELLLFAADALAFYQQYIENLNDEEFVICDRLNITGALTYQKAGGATDGQIMAMHQVLQCMGWQESFDHLFVFLSPYEILQSRLENPNLIDQDIEQGNKKDRFESRGDTFMEKVCANYEAIPQNKELKYWFSEISVIDATKSIDDVFEQIIDKILI